ncbi:MAG: cadherin-like domain-containing protein, partial [Cyanobacteriota bacterium]|nr:cadherin-like domain-containing protein [Cyanobacteriota bacterium]
MTPQLTKSDPTTGVQPFLENVLEDESFSIYTLKLLAGYTSDNGGTLSLSDLKVSTGSVANNRANYWDYTPASDFNGTVTVSFIVNDSNGGSTWGANSFQITPVNDLPSLTGDKASLPTIDNNSSLTFTSTQLLQGYADVDGDALSVSDLTVDQEEV